MGSTQPKTKAECLRQIENLKFENDRDKRSIENTQMLLKTTKSASASFVKSHKDRIATLKADIANRKAQIDNLKALKSTLK